MKTCGIYGIFNTVNGKVLVGSSGNIAERWRNHRNQAKRGAHLNPHFQRAWKMYGESSFEFRVLEECPPACLVPREDYWMAFHKSLDLQFGYNLQNGSMTFISEETRKRMRAAMKGAHSVSPEQRLRLSILHKGKCLSEETKLKISLAGMGRKHSLETRKKMSRSMKGAHRISEEHKKKLLALHLGIPLSEAVRKHMSEAMKRRWASGDMARGRKPAEPAGKTPDADTPAPLARKSINPLGNEGMIRPA